MGLLTPALLTRLCGCGGAARPWAELCDALPAVVLEAWALLAEHLRAIGTVRACAAHGGLCRCVPSNPTEGFALG